MSLPPSMSEYPLLVFLRLLENFCFYHWFWNSITNRCKVQSGRDSIEWGNTWYFIWNSSKHLKIVSIQLIYEFSAFLGKETWYYRDFHMASVSWSSPPMSPLKESYTFWFPVHQSFWHPGYPVLGQFYHLCCILIPLRHLFCDSCSKPNRKGTCKFGWNTILQIRLSLIASYNWK